VTGRAVPGATGRAARLTVELAGIPGAGKSRLARMLAREAAARGLRISQPQVRYGPGVPGPRRLSRKALACGATALRGPVGTARLGQSVLRSGQPGAPEVAGRLVQLLLARAVLARAVRTEGLSIVDEGLVQGLWSTGLRGDVEPVLAALEASRPEPSADLLVVLRVEPELALSRLAARSSRHSRTQRLSEGEQLAELRRGAALLDRLADWWCTSSGGIEKPFVVAGPEESGNDRERLVELVCERIS
jgi:hypothetical protein